MSCYKDLTSYPQRIARSHKFHGKMAIDKKIADEIIDMEIWD